MISTILIIATAYSQGADPFHPRTRHLWALSLVAAAYVSLRGALILERLLDPARSKTRTGRSIVGLFSGNRHAIDRRMDARRARVEAARASENNDDSAHSD